MTTRIVDIGNVQQLPPPLVSDLPIERRWSRGIQDSARIVKTHVGTSARLTSDQIFDPVMGLIRPRVVKPFVAEIRLVNNIGEQFTFDSVDFRLASPGSSTSVWSNKQQQGLFEITFSVNRVEQFFNINIKNQREPTNAHEFLEILRFAQATSKPLTVQLIDRSLGIQILEAQITTGLSSAPDPATVQLLMDLDAIQRKVGRPIFFTPSPMVSEQEWQSIGKLRTILHEGGFTTTWNDYAPEVSREGVRQILEGFANGQSQWFRIEGEEKEILFGVELPLGPVQYLFRAKLDNEQELREWLATEPAEEATIQARFVPVDDDRYFRVDFPAWKVSAPAEVTVGPEIELTESQSAVIAELDQQHLGGANPVPASPLSPAIEQKFLADWPTLSAEQRMLWLQVLDTLLSPDNILLEQLEQLEDARYLESLTSEDREAVPMDQVLREIGYLAS